MKNKKNILISIIIIFIIIICTIFAIFTFKYNNKKHNENINDEKINDIYETNKDDEINKNNGENYNKDIDESIKLNGKVNDNISLYYTVDSCIGNFIKMIVDKDVKGIISLLDEKFIFDNNLNENNILEFFDKKGLLNVLDYDILNMSVENEDQVFRKYYTYGNYRKNDGKRITGKLIINIDIDAQVFSIIPEFN